MKKIKKNNNLEFVRFFRMRIPQADPWIRIRIHIKLSGSETLKKIEITGQQEMLNIVKKNGKELQFFSKT